ncbi:hypothetical protein M427DRAFT_52489 [Gonapodya prolifera JEL478]|uniref:Prolyl 4-hydroxylase alpha subunit domain-containing protein n=1 Tax=Gonapodya prolifera (strain JEL478) TaxID=1344416 RepID=A0A139AUS6_GONPJ|nr:hypothetical protein M427DRAFT_52489 [Gonapodya prolifera JEL478]|eukprot:KXS20245.1 hypothetical protein M427DRAFT_52489 [Gonapodya prolifera JEL478]
MSDGVKVTRTGKEAKPAHLGQQEAVPLVLVALVALSLLLHLPAYWPGLLGTGQAHGGHAVHTSKPLVQHSQSIPGNLRGNANIKLAGQPVAAYKSDDGLLGKPWKDFSEYECDTTYSGVHIISRDPLLMVIDNFLRTGEPEHLVQTATPLYSRSTVVSTTDDEENKEFRVVSDYRTSSTAYLPRNGDPVIRCVEARAAAFSGYPVRNTESLQSVHYGVGQQYKVHHDWFPPEDPISAPHLLRGGQRVSTFFVYLNDVPKGGRTWFPSVNVSALAPGAGGLGWGVDDEGGVAVWPRKGRAAFWINVDKEGNGDSRTLHAGMPPLDGEKFGLNIWQRFGEFD